MVKIANIDIHNIPLENLLSTLDNGVIFTPNVDHIMKLQKDECFYKVYSKADYKLCDSKIIQIASNFLGTPITEKISGSDFFPAFYNYNKNNININIFLLGSASQNIVDMARKTINLKVGRKIITEAHSPSFGFENNEDENIAIIEKINNSNATVLAVGVGAPKQEKWIIEHKDKLPKIKIFIAIGATIDFEAGHIKRAPKLVSEYGFEWLYRLVSDPKRLWKRYLLDDVPFIYLLLKQKYGLYKDPWK